MEEDFEIAENIDVDIDDKTAAITVGDIIDDLPLPIFEAHLAKVKAKIPAEFQAKARCQVSYGYMAVTYERPATEAEIAEEIELSKERERRKLGLTEQNEREEYERLKAKFEPKEAAAA